MQNSVKAKLTTNIMLAVFGALYQSKQPEKCNKNFIALLQVNMIGKKDKPLIIPKKMYE